MLFHNALRAKFQVNDFIENVIVELDKLPPPQARMRNQFDKQCNRGLIIYLIANTAAKKQLKLHGWFLGYDICF